MWFSLPLHYPITSPIPIQSASKTTLLAPPLLPHAAPHVLHRRIARIIPPLLLLLQARHKWLTILRLHHLPVQLRVGHGTCVGREPVAQAMEPFERVRAVQRLLRMEVDVEVVDQRDGLRD